MITNFKYSYISFDDHHHWSNDPVVDTSLSYKSYSVDYNYKFTDTLRKGTGFINSLFKINTKNTISGVVPPAIKYHSPGVVVFERPPSYQVIQYASQNVSNLDDDTPVYTYRIPIPWQLYIITYNTNTYFCNSVRMLFMNSSLNSPEQNLYMPPIPNFFTNGLLCRPMYDNMEDVDRYSKDLSGVIASAYDWIWNSGFNHDLTENLYHVNRQKAPIEFTVNYQTIPPNPHYFRNVGPQHVRSILEQWEKIDFDNILNLNWPNPSLTQGFESDREYYWESDPDRFSLNTDEDDPSEVIDVTDLYHESQTYRQVINAVLTGDDSPSMAHQVIDRDFLQAITSLTTLS